MDLEAAAVESELRRCFVDVSEGYSTTMVVMKNLFVLFQTSALSALALLKGFDDESIKVLDDYKTKLDYLGALKNSDFFENAL